MSLKRFTDITLAGTGLIIAAPLMLVIAIIIKLESKGPIYYRCKRVGRFGRPFDMLKFRTMVNNADNVDCKLCAGLDVRVTPFGKLLRRTKLNELPQLINVVKGDMSVVGPRPEDPKFIDHYKEKWQIVLTAKPGIVGPNQIRHRNEEDLFDPTQDPEAFYLKELLPQKLEVDIEYARNNRFWSDMGILATGLYVTIFGSGRFLEIFKHPGLLARPLEDAALSTVAYLLAYYVRFETITWDYTVWPNLLIVIAVNPVLFGSLGVYRRSARFFSTSDILLLAKVVVLSCIFLMVGNKLFLGWQGHSRTVFLCYPLILMCLMTGTRLFRRMVLERKELEPDEIIPTKDVLIYGAGRLGVETAKRLRFEPGIKVIGFVDDDPKMRQQTILGLKVLGAGSDLPFLKSLYNMEQIFVAFKSPRPDQLSKVRHHCSETGLTEILVRSSLPEPRFRPFVVTNSFRRVRLSDLLEMKEVLLNTTQLKTSFERATVVIDGAGDHLGEHLCRELLNLDVGKLIILESCPSRLYRLNRFINSLGNHQTALYSYLVPVGSHDLFESVLHEHSLTYLICNGPSRPVPNSFSNWPAVFLTSFIETIRKVRLAKRMGCKCFSFLSPYLKDSLSTEEKALNLLSEHYVALCGKEGEQWTRTGVIRLPNILEDESDTLRDDMGEKAESASSKDLQRTVRFTSARYAARIVLNSHPLHQNGEILVETASQAYRVGEFVEFYFETLMKGKQLGSRKNGPKLKPLDPSLGEQEFRTGYNDTPVSDVMTVNNPERPDIVGLDFLTEFNTSCLTATDKKVIKEFISYLKFEFQDLPNHDLRGRSTLTAAAQ